MNSRPQLTDRLAAAYTASRAGQAMAGLRRRAVPTHWSSMFAEIALFSLVIVFMTGIFLTFFYDPSNTVVVYDGTYVPLKGIEMSRALDSTLHVSFDVDFLDPATAPGVGTMVPGGATYREAHLIMELLHDSGLMCSLDVVELNPFLDERGRTARVMVELVGSLFGQQITDRPTPTNAITAGE